MPQIFAHPDLPIQHPRRLWPQILGVALVFFGITLFLALGSYDWHDVSAQCAPPQAPPKNLMGYAGAWFAYATTLLLGFAAWTLPLWVALSGVLLVLNQRLGWRFVGMLLGTLSVLGLSAQVGLISPSAVEFYGPQNLNNGGFPGGSLGDLLINAVVPAIGGGSTCCLLILLLLLGICFLVGFRFLFASLIRPRETQRTDSVDVRIAPEPSADAPALAPKTPQKPLTREEARAQKAAEREAEKARKAAEREAARAQKAAEREAEKERKAAEREAAREARLFEKEQEKEAKAAEKAKEEEERKEAMKKRTEEFLERQRQEAESARVKARVEATTQAPSPAPAQPASPPAPAPEKQAIEVHVPTPAPLPEEDEEENPDEDSFEPPVHIDYTLPTADLLNEPPPKVEDNGESATECGKIIVETLGEFGITVSIVGIHRGPVITQYHLMPAPGVRINKVNTYATDLQRALSAQQIRILAPIPGKSVIGIEVPNERADIVSIREVAEGEVWRARVAKSFLPLLLGKDIGGADYTADLASMPHLLIAGATGAGKSACINSLLTGLLLSRTPDELRLIMVDPKFVEFTPYAEIPHLLVPIITEPKKVGVALQWAIGEMNRRLKLFARGGARNIATYNQNPIQTELFGNSLVDPSGKLPYIVIVIDELADLMLTARAEIENRISNLAAKARAAGIHMIIATQRPSVNVVTGVIKANFPGRIAFKVASNVDSSTILDGHGAECLLGRGDMLVHDPRVMGNVRVQGCFVTDEEVAEVTNNLRAQGRPAYVSSIKNKLDAIKDDEEDDEDEPIDDAPPPSSKSRSSSGNLHGDFDAPSGSSDSDDDEVLVRKALEIFRESRRASTSSLQRRLGLGYNRAARILDKIEKAGYVGPPASNGRREILVDLDELLGKLPDDDDGADGIDDVDDPE